MDTEIVIVIVIVIVAVIVAVETSGLLKMFSFSCRYKRLISPLR